MKLRLAVCLVGLLLFGAAESHAQSVPTLEVALNYSHVSVTPTNSQIGNFSMNGASGQVAYNVNKWISGVADVGFYTHATMASTGEIGLLLHPTEISYTLGPRVSYRHFQRFTPFGQILIGVVHATGGGNVNTFDDNVKSQTKLAYAAGGGIDVKVKSYLAVRPVAIDVQRTQFAELGTTRQVQTNLRISVGLVLLF